MHHRPPEAMLDDAVRALAASEDQMRALDHLPVPIYATDKTGTLTFWNSACAKFAGRTPQAGRDRWCVTWHLYTTAGDPLPHDKCPMAESIEQKRPIRDKIAIAERPNGSRRAFRAYPTPLFNEAQELVGAVNMLIDVTEEQASALADQAERCKRLAEATYDRQTSNTLAAMARGYEDTAARLQSSQP